VCGLEEIAERYPAFKIIGAPEVREVPDDARSLPYAAGRLA
jgi:hypothetical protein